MAMKQWFRGGLALVTGLALLVGSNPGTAADPNKEELKKAEKAAKIVQTISAADELIQFGLDNNMPTSVIAGVEALTAIQAKYMAEDEKEKIEVEGDKAEMLKAEKKRLIQLVEKALTMDAAKDSKTIKEYGKAVMTKVEEGSRGTAAGHTRTVLHLQPGTPQTIKINFYGGQSAIINICKTSNVGVPIKVTVKAPNGSVVAPLGTNALSYNFRVTGNQVLGYTITSQITEGKASCEVAITTN